jgi:hypothetical protein
MRIGYARVATTEQNLDLRRHALKRAGCDKIIEDTASGGKVHRSGPERVRETLRPVDVQAVWRLDRLGRSLKHLIEMMPPALCPESQPMHTSIGQRLVHSSTRTSGSPHHNRASR